MDFSFFSKDNVPLVSPLFAGYQKCESGHNYAYYNCQYFLVHYCISGRGTVNKDGKCYKVSPGQIFIICPGDTVSYTADKLDPWEYAWVSFEFSAPEILANLPIVSGIRSDIFISVKEKLKDEECTKLFVTGKIYELLSELSEDASHIKIDYPKNIKLYIQLRYANEISVEQIARSLNINRRYMSRIFKQRYGKTVMEYLVDYRLKKASERLLSGASVADAAIQCGYRDVFNFSKMFKKKYGTSPSEYKKSNI